MNEQRQARGIVGIVTKYGLIQGVLWFAVFLVATLTGVKQSWVGPVVDTVLLIVLMVLAHREFKKTHDGMMTYPQGLGSGTLLATEAAIVAGILAYIYVKYINTGYIAAAVQAQRATLARRGITGAQAQQAMTIMGAIMTPAGVVITSLVEGVILGFIVALIVSIVTQKGDSRVVI